MSRAYIDVMRTACLYDDVVDLYVSAVEVELSPIGIDAKNISLVVLPHEVEGFVPGDEVEVALTLAKPAHEE